MTGALHRFRDGDAGALDELIDTYARPAFAAAMAVHGDRAQAEQTVKEALAIALDNVDRFDPAVHGEASWILATVRNQAMQRQHRARQSDRREPSLEPDPVWRGIMLGVTVENVRAAIDSLSEAQRETVSLAYWKGLRPVEIAKMRGVPEELVRTNLRLGLERLRDVLARTAREGRPRES